MDTYVSGFSDKLLIYKFEDGKLTLERSQKGLGPDPTWMAIEKDTVYACHHVTKWEGQNGGGVTVWKITADGTLKKVQSVRSMGDDPCHLIVDKTKNLVYISNYAVEANGVFAVYSLMSDGSLGDLIYTEDYGKGSHAHGTVVNGNFVYVADLGSDKIWQYTCAGGKISKLNPECISTHSGSGPRHMVVHGALSVLYVLNELDSTITAYQIDKVSGQLTEIMNTYKTLPKDVDVKNYPAEIMVHPNGRFLYASNRGYGSIACFKVDSGSGTLTLADVLPLKSSGHWPRHFNIDPSGKYLIAADQKSATLEVLEINEDTGTLTERQFLNTEGAPTLVAFK